MKFKALFILLLLVLSLCFTGCGAAGNGPTPVSYSGASDSMTVFKEWNKEFYMIKAADDYYEIRYRDDYLEIEDMVASDECDFPEMNNGDLLKVVADVDMYYGGIGGHNYSIKLNKVNSTEYIDYNTVIDEFQIEDISDDIKIERLTIIKMHRDKESGDAYLILPVTLPSDYDLVIYKQGEKLGTGTEVARYDFDYDQNNKNLRDFLSSLKKP